VIIRRLLAMWIALAFVAGVTGAVVDVFDLADADSTVAGRSTTSTTADESLRPDQIRVSGTLTAVHIEGCATKPLPLPVTIEAPVRGASNGADIKGIEVGGKPATIVWDAGRPLQLSGAGPLLLDPVTVELGPGGVVLAVGGTVVGFTEGEHRIDTPVAVGQSGLARPKDSVVFTATGQSTMALRGTSRVTVTTRVACTGPGLVGLAGQLTVVTASGSREVAKVDMPKGAFELTIAPAQGGWRVDGLLQGKATTPGR
jgi:hypothetical protein